MPRASGRIVPLLAVGLLVLVQRRERLDAHAEEVALDVARERLELVRRVHVRWHAEDLVELFERERLRLGHEEERHHESEHAGGGCGVSKDGMDKGGQTEGGREGRRGGLTSTQRTSQTFLVGSTRQGAQAQ